MTPKERVKKAEKSGIHIKSENRGTFTRYCKGLGFNGVTRACIAKGKKSKNPTTRKRAVFAENAKYKWDRG